MNILVGELAKLYGLSSQALHYYEDKGILNPYRDVQNGYRYYSYKDLSRLGGLKKYRNAEFSLQEGITLSGNITDKEIAMAFQNKKERLLDQIQRKQNVIRQIEKDLELFNRYQSIGSTFVEEYLEGFLKFESTIGRVMLQDSKILKEATPWFENIMFTFPLYTYYLDENSNIIQKVTYGMGAEKSIATYLDLKCTKSVSRIDGGLFLTSIINIEVDVNLTYYINKILQYAKEKGYNIRDNPVSRSIFTFIGDDNKRKAYVMLYIPISKKL